MTLAVQDGEKPFTLLYIIGAFAGLPTPALAPQGRTRKPMFRTPLCLAILAACTLAEAFLRGAFQFSLGETIEGGAIALMLLGVLKHPGSAAARVLNSNPMTWIGRVSYSLYLLQQLFLFPIGHSYVAVFPLNFIATFGAACQAIISSNVHCLSRNR